MVLLSADGVRTNEIMRRNGKSKPACGAGGNASCGAAATVCCATRRDLRTFAYLGKDIAERVAMLSQTDPSAEGTHWAAMTNDLTRDRHRNAPDLVPAKWRRSSKTRQRRYLITPRSQLAQRTKTKGSVVESHGHRVQINF
jgi:hypothetical protein